MHTNHRRKNKYRSGRRRWWVDIGPYKQDYWARERARERMLMVHAEYDMLRDRHPKSILWEAL